MYKNYYDLVLTEIQRALSKISNDSIEELIANITNPRRIFIAGRGRTGLLMKSFAIRLMQMGFEVYVVGESITPAIKAGDMLIVGSGSGETESLVAITEKAKRLGAKVTLITMYKESTIASKADSVFVIPAKGSKVDKDADSDSKQPMCNLFEQTLLILMDILTLIIIDQKNIDIKTLYDRHANLE